MFNNYCISHMKREGNTMADGMSNEACGLELGEVRWWNDINETVKWN